MFINVYAIYMYDETMTAFASCYNASIWHHRHCHSCLWKDIVESIAIFMTYESSFTSC